MQRFSFFSSGGYNLPEIEGLIPPTSSFEMSVGHSSEENDFTMLLAAAQAGDPADPARRNAEAQLCELVNAELRRAAAGLVRGGNGLAQPTSLVNEVFLKVFRKGVCDDLKNRRYFFAVAIDQMRQELRERARKRKTLTQGGHLERQPLDVALDSYLDDFQNTRQLEFLILEEALARLKSGRATSRQYEILELHFFGGLELKEIAALLHLDASVISRELKTVKAKLAMEVKQRG